MGKQIEKAAKSTLNVMTLGASDAIGDALNPDLPKLPDAPEVAPVADDQAIGLANKRKASKRRKGGRAGTMLTEGSTLG